MAIQYDKQSDSKYRPIDHTERAADINTFSDLRPEGITQNKMKESIRTSPVMVAQRKTIQRIVRNSDTTQLVVNTDIETAGRQKAALRSLNAVGGQQLMNSLFGFDGGDTVDGLMVLARRVVHQFIPPGGSVRIENSQGVELLPGTPLIPEEQYTAIPVPPVPIWNSMLYPPGSFDKGGGGGSDSEDDSGGGGSGEHLLPSGLLDT